MSCNNLASHLKEIANIMGANSVPDVIEQIRNMKSPIFEITENTSFEDIKTAVFDKIYNKPKNFLEILPIKRFLLNNGVDEQVDTFLKKFIDDNRHKFVSIDNVSDLLIKNFPSLNTQKRLLDERDYLRTDGFVISRSEIGASHQIKMLMDFCYFNKRNAYPKVHIPLGELMDGISMNEAVFDFMYKTQMETENKLKSISNDEFVEKLSGAFRQELKKQRYPYNSIDIGISKNGDDYILRITNKDDLSIADDGNILVKFDFESIAQETIDNIKMAM